MKQNKYRIIFYEYNNKTNQQMLDTLDFNSFSEAFEYIYKKSNIYDEIIEDMLRNNFLSEYNITNERYSILLSSISNKGYISIVEKDKMFISIIKMIEKNSYYLSSNQKFLDNVKDLFLEILYKRNAYNQNEDYHISHTIEVDTNNMYLFTIKIEDKKSSLIINKNNDNIIDYDIELKENSINQNLKTSLDILPNELSDVVLEILRSIKNVQK